MPNFRRADELFVNVKTLKHIGAVLCVAALVVPAGVSAKGPSGDHGNQQKGQSHTKSKRCNKTPRVGFNVKGTVVSYDATSKTLVVDVDTNGVSRHAKKYVTEDPLTVVGATVYDGIKAGDKVVVHGKIDKPKKKCTETDDVVKASAKFTRVTKQDTTPEQEQQNQS